MLNELILPLLTPDAALERVGGKGASLARLALAGYPVPDGWLISTDAYRHYVSANNLGERVLQTVADADVEDPSSLRVTSDDIRRWFSDGEMPSELANALREMHAALEGKPVAVRSSATAEDLPEISFAGQQDTFLNVIGGEALLEAIVNCWSSLWTARAIGYRHRNGLAHADVAMAIVVQVMVPAEVSGVLFTAHPVSGRRTRTVIDATLGLGEALVSGQVEPDHYEVDTLSNRILAKRLGAKSLAIHGAEKGGLVIIREDASTRQALSDEQILQLSQLGQRVAAEYGFPQDVEWAWAGGQLYLLQSRPITALFPLPSEVQPDPLRVLVSFAAVQGFLEPVTPLGQDVIRLIFAGGGTLFGFQETYLGQQVVRSAAERLWIDLTTVVRNPIGRRVVPRVCDLVEPAIGQALATLWDDPRLAPERTVVRPRTLGRIARFLVPFWWAIFRSWPNPEAKREALQKLMEERLRALEARSESIAAGPNALLQRVDLVHDLYGTFPFVVPQVFSAALGGLVAWAILNRLAGHLPQTMSDGRRLALDISRSLPHNVTTEMDLALWETAKAVRADAESVGQFGEHGAQQLADDFLAGNLPHPAQRVIAQFLDQYGMRGLGEIDFGRPRWRQEPAPIMQMLQNYLRLKDDSAAPDVVFRRGEQVAEEASARLESAVRQTRAGWLKAGVVRWATRRFRALAGLRESPKLYIVTMMDTIRQGLLESGRQLAEQGFLDRPDDLFFLRLSELEALAQGEPGDWQSLVGERRAAHDMEKRRRQIPRLLLSDGTAFYEGYGVPEGTGAGVLAGSPVSPGIVEGKVRVVLDPYCAQLAPGEIIVCPGTDPAWTPLFLAAGGLVMEVGGLMTHGSVVAREYGIPAVVGVDRATQRLRTGQRVRVDGNAGLVSLLVD